MLSFLVAGQSVALLGRGVTQGSPWASWAAGSGPSAPAWALRPESFACIPPQAAALAALGTSTFPLLKLKTRHITKLRVPKISGGKHY